MNTTKIPTQLTLAVLIICILPTSLNLLGVDFGSSTRAFHVDVALSRTPNEVIDAMHYKLSGSFTHTILEWSAFCTAIFIVILSFTHFYLKRDPVTPVIGVALFCAGCMDAFHTLAADRLIQGLADNQNLIPFTWAICRLFNALILLFGAGIFLTSKQGLWKGSISFVLSNSLVFGLIAYGIVYVCAHSAVLPTTIFPNSIVTRPWDVAPLLLFIVAGVFVFPRLYKKSPSFFSHALVISALPQIVTQLHMAFGSTALFDNHFNIAHFLKIVAYFIPFSGLSLDYIRTYREKTNSVKQLEQAQVSLKEQIVQREKVEKELIIAKQELEHRVIKRTEELLRTNQRLESEVTERKQSELRAFEKSQQLVIALLQLQQTQSQLIQTEKMSALGLLVAGVAHEINNPVSFIKGNINPALQYAQDLLCLLQLYQQQYPNPTLEIRRQIEEIELEFIIEDLPKLLNSMHTGVERISGIVSSLRAFSRKDSLEMKAVNIHDGLDSTLLILQHRLKAVGSQSEIVVIKNYGNLPQVDCYAGQMNQVFMNLLTNAIDAIDEENLRLTKEEIKANPYSIEISTRLKDEKWVEIRIADNGSGIPDHVLPHLFDPFFTTKPVGKGTGLGLSISYQIVVEKHGGYLHCISAPGEGAEFIIEIPIRQQN